MLNGTHPLTGPLALTPAESGLTIRSDEQATLSGGIDKRVLAQGKDAIDRHIDYILPAMKKRGGYTPTCDHGVPAEVTLENYRYCHQRCLEFA